MKEKAKVDGNHDAQKLELRFEAANQNATARRVNRQDKDANGRNGRHSKNLRRVVVTRK